MYAIFYAIISISGIFLILNKKNNKYDKNSLFFFILNCILIFFIFNNVSADKAYYENIFLNDYFQGFQRQGFDLFFYYFAYLISFFQNPKIANYILYSLFICSLYFFSKKFKYPVHIVIMFFPYILVAVMQGFPRQAWALMCIIISFNLIFYLIEKKKNQSFNQDILKIYIFFIFLSSVFFHYSAIIFLGIYVFYIFTNLNKKLMFLSFYLFLFIIFALNYKLNFFGIYFEKLNNLSDFLATRENYSIKGFVSRSVIIFFPALLILFYYLSNSNYKKINFFPIDKFFVFVSFFYVFLSLFVLKFQSFLLVLDRLNIYFFLITIYFFGRFLFFSFFSKKIQELLIFVSIIYLNFYLILWTIYSKSYYEFKYNFSLF